MSSGLNSGSLSFVFLIPKIPTDEHAVTYIISLGFLAISEVSIQYTSKAAKPGLRRIQPLGLPGEKLDFSYDRFLRQIEQK